MKSEHNMIVEKVEKNGNVMDVDDIAGWGISREYVIRAARECDELYVDRRDGRDVVERLA